MAALGGGAGVLYGNGSPLALPAVPDLDRWLALAGLGLDEVTLTGQRFTNDLDVFDALDLQNARSFVAFDSLAARARIERLPWVATAAITRVYPGRLDIRISERSPFAMWRRGAHYQLVDISGRVLSAARADDYPALPRVSGEGAASEAATLLALVDRHPALKGRLEDAERIGERRWTLHLKGNVTVHLPADREAVALAEVAAADGLEALVAQSDRVVDLRAGRRVTVRPTAPPPAHAQSLAQGGS